MNDESYTRDDRYAFLFHHLVAMFQTLALQQLGKLTNPITGQLERDLHQARITIDMLHMLKDKTAGNLEQSEQAVLDRALMDLQMNYVDEAARTGDTQSGDEEGEAEQTAEEEPAREAPPETTPAEKQPEGAKSDTPSGEGGKKSGARAKGKAKKAPQKKKGK